VNDLIDLLKQPEVVLGLSLVTYVLLPNLKGKVSDRLLPLIALASNFAIGLAHGLMLGETPKKAAASVLMGLVSGLASVGIHENVKAAKTPPGASDGPSGPPTPKSPRPNPTELSRVGWMGALLFGWLVVGGVWACTAAERRTAADVTAAAAPLCEEGLVIAAAPELAPLCAGLVEVEAIVSELIAEHTGDAGALARSYRPTMAEVHRRLAAKHAKDGGK
jgi:hypothetical protein